MKLTHHVFHASGCPTLVCGLQQFDQKQIPDDRCYVTCGVTNSAQLDQKQTVCHTTCDMTPAIRDVFLIKLCIVLV